MSVCTFLHDDVVDVVVVDDLKVLDAGLRHPTVEVEHVALSVVAPHGRLVLECDDALHVLALEPLDQAVVLRDGLEIKGLFN